MSGPTLESVLLSSLMDEYGADEETWRALRSLSRVEAAVLAWIEGRLADGDVRDDVAEELRNVGHHPPSKYAEVAFMDANHAATAALAAVRGVLGEGVAR